MKSKNRFAMACLLALALVAGSTAGAAEPLKVTLKDWTARGFSPDLINYTVPTPATGAKNLRVVDDSGKSLPVQLTPGDNGQSTLSFVASLAPSGTSTYTISDDGQAAAAPAAVSTTHEGDTLILANQLLAVRVPAPMAKTYDPPIPADKLPAPILEFRDATGGWRGAGTINHQEPVKSVRITQSADGPVFTEITYRMDYQSGGYYQAAVRVTDQAPFALVSEEYDFGVSENTHFWELDLSKGWSPDSAELMAMAGQGYSPVTYPTLADEEKTPTTGPNIGVQFTKDKGMATRCIYHDSCWGSRFVSYYGIHQASARQANPKNYPLAIVAPLHKGEWRRVNGLPVYDKGNQVTVSFPMDVAQQSWRHEPGSEVSPFSCHEHDPSLSTTFGRRVWGLVLAQPTMTVFGFDDPKLASVGYSVRDLYGVVGLDRYKDYVLSWTDTKVTYPRVYITPQEAQKYRDAVKADPSFPLAPLLQKYYWFTGDAATARREIPQVQKDLGNSANFIMTSLSIPHHQTLSQYGEPMGHTESVLSWPDLPDTDRANIRARLALLAYLLTEPDVTSAGDGSHHGNPNMGVSRLMDRSNVAALIPDHPMYRTWADYMGMFLAYKAGTFMAPGGAWIEYGSYHLHGYGKLIRGLMGVLASGATDADESWAYNRADLEYLVNLLSPVDSRYGSRTIPGTANSPTLDTPHFMQSMGTIADRDPEFAANLHWAWDNNGQMVATGADGNTILAMARPEIKDQEPKLTSRVFPGYGVIFRAHQGEDETALYLRSGYQWSHWSQDQGNMMLYSKGAVLLPPQPYAYGAPKDPKFPDKNFIHFGAPENTPPHDWCDSNIIDSNFGSSVDYAHSSTGFADWYINPGDKPGWGDPRPLVDGLGQKEGAFTWDRQVAFMKGATGKSPNYFVIRDTTNGPGQLASWFNLSLLGRKKDVQVSGSKVSLDTEWPTKLDIVFPGRKELPFEMREDNLALFLGPYSRFAGDEVAGKVASRDWVDPKGTPKVIDPKLKENGFTRDSFEQRVMLRLQSVPGQEVAWVLYPRGQGEAEPQVTQLAPGVTKVVTSESTDYVFLSTTALTYSGESVEFTGNVGAVRVGNDGKTTLVLSTGPGKIGYKGYVVESQEPFQKVIPADGAAQPIPAATWAINAPDALGGAQPVINGVTKASSNGVTQYVVNSPTPIDAMDGNVHLQARNATIQISQDEIRFVTTRRTYVELSVGPVGVRGVGPFDLTFKSDTITGKVDGDVRTLVTSWPEKIIRPGYYMDGVRWCAGFCDEHSPNRGTTSPLFTIAMGVVAGPHTVKIDEWEWPAMPKTPARATLSGLQ